MIVNIRPTVCDIGAGVAHLTIPLLQQGYKVDAVEPNDEMRAIGIQRTQDFKNIIWHCATGEDTKRHSNFYDTVTYGSSLNVMDTDVALNEAHRILKNKGFMACLWNHRDLHDPLQNEIEHIIKNHVPDYDYGNRRIDQTAIINASNCFESVKLIEGKIIHKVKTNDWCNAWYSHATLHRQSGESFYEIINDIKNFIHQNYPDEIINVPYVTRVWYARKK